MNLEAAIAAIDAAVLAKTGRHLSNVETILLQGAGQGKTYEQIAETCKYSLMYLKQAAGPKVWKLLSEALGVEVSKTNFRAVLEQQWHFDGAPITGATDRKPPQEGHPQLKSLDVATSRVLRQEGVIARTEQHPDWGEAPDVSIFYGRTQELATLEQWIVQDRCRLVTVVGMGGIGKTTLAVRCARQIESEFESVVWRSLRHAPPLQEILADLIQSLSNQQTRLSADADVTQVIDYLQQHRCLLVLDDVEAILQRGELAGHYRQEYEGYKEFLRRIVETAHQSCLLLTSLEKPREIAALEGKTLPVRSLQLTGLKEAAQEIFREKNLSEPSKWAELIQLYRGNPLALKIVATTIQELFGGKVGEFLRQNTIVFGDLRDILDEQFERLSELETEILYWLATECQPVSLTKIRADILSPVSPSEAIETLESLLRRALIARSAVGSDVLFTLQQPVVKEYVIDRFIKQICAEIRDIGKTQKLEKLELLRNHTLVNTRSQDEAIKALQVRLILTPVKDRLCTIFRDESLMVEQLTKVLSLLQGKSPLAVGYARENLQTLLSELEADLNQDLSYSGS